MWSWQIRSSSPVEMPGSTTGSIISSTSAASRPASRIPAMSLSVLIDTLLTSTFPDCCFQRELIGQFTALRGRYYSERLQAGCHLWYKARRFRKRRELISTLFVYRMPGAGKPVGHLERAEGEPNLETSYDTSKHARVIAGRRALWPPNSLLEPEDGSIHLRRAEQNSYHQPRAHCPCVQ